MGGTLEPAGGVPTEVDIETLAAVIPWLNGLKEYVQGSLHRQAVDLLVLDTQKDVIFGKYSGGAQMYDAHKSHMDKALKSIDAIGKSLDVAARATADIVQNYKDAEHNNKLTSDKIDTTFASAQSSKHHSGSPGQSRPNDDAGTIQA